MSEMLLKHNLKTLRLPTMLSEYAQLSREAADADENYEQYLLRLTELEVATRSANALAARIKNAGFPVLKDLETYDFAAMPSLSKQKILELARSQWIEENTNACFIGNSGTGKTHLSVIAWPRLRVVSANHVRFYTAASLVNQLGGSAEAVPPRPADVGPGETGSADRGRVGLPELQSERRGTAVPGLRRTL